MNEGDEKVKNTNKKLNWNQLHQRALWGWLFNESWHKTTAYVKTYAILKIINVSGSKVDWIWLMYHQIQPSAYGILYHEIVIRIADSIGFYIYSMISIIKSYDIIDHIMEWMKSICGNIYEL